MMHLDWPYLKKYEKENASLSIVEKTQNRIVFLGDSITEFWQHEIPDFFSKKNYINRGISGQTTPQMLIRFRADVINLNPSVVVILAGANDIAGNTGPATLEMIFNNIQSMVELATANQIKVILCSVLPANFFPWNPKEKPANTIIEFNSLLQNYAKENQLHYLDYYSSMVDHQKGMIKQYSNDGVHPNKKGYQIMIPLIEEAITLVNK
jgi:lysophospholipase L1-like esterase